MNESLDTWHRRITQAARSEHMTQPLGVEQLTGQKRLHFFVGAIPLARFFFPSEQRVGLTGCGEVKMSTSSREASLLDVGF